MSEPDILDLSSDAMIEDPDSNGHALTRIPSLACGYNNGLDHAIPQEVQEIHLLLVHPHFRANF